MPATPARIQRRLGPVFLTIITPYLFALALLGALPDAAAAVPAQAGGPQVESQVMEASREWFTALMQGDFQAVDRLETDDFLTVQQAPGAVAVVDKAQQLASLRKAGDKRPRFDRELSGVKVRTYGQTAVLTALATYRQPGDKGQAVAQAVVTEVWVNESGRWRIAHLQSADLPARPKP